MGSLSQLIPGKLLNFFKFLFVIQTILIYTYANRYRKIFSHLYVSFLDYTGPDKVCLSHRSPICPIFYYTNFQFKTTVFSIFSLFNRLFCIIEYIKVVLIKITRSNVILVFNFKLLSIMLIDPTKVNSDPIE